VVVLDHLSETQRRAYIIADNRLAMNAGWDEKALAAELGDLALAGVDLALIGFTTAELDLLLAEVEEPAQDVADDIPEPPATPVTQAGDVWQTGKHRLICGDCRDENTMRALFLDARRRSQSRRRHMPHSVNTTHRAGSSDSPRRVCGMVSRGGCRHRIDPGAGRVVLPEHKGPRRRRRAELVRDGPGGGTQAPVGWMFVMNSVGGKRQRRAGGWGNRFKNAFEPVFHFSRQSEIKFRPEAVGHVSDDCFDYSPDNPVSKSGSGLLGTGPRGESASLPPEGSQGWGNMRRKLVDGRHEGIARPSNVIECKSESGQGSHSAPFPRALVEFFVLAFTDPGDVVFDPFMGSGTTMAAAEVLGRIGYGAEISPGYCDVILGRMMTLTGNERSMSRAQRLRRSRLRAASIRGRR